MLWLIALRGFPAIHAVISLHLHAGAANELTADFSVIHLAHAFARILMNCFQFILERAERRRVADADIVVIDKARDVALAHVVDDRLDVARAHCDVVGRRGRAVFRHRDRSGAVATRRGCAQFAGIELKERFNVEALASVVLEALVDDLQNVVLSESGKLAGVGTPC